MAEGEAASHEPFPSVPYSSCDAPPWLSPVNYEMPEGANVHVLHGGDPRIISSTTPDLPAGAAAPADKPDGKPAKGKAKARWGIDAGRVWFSNDAEEGAVLVLTLPQHAQCVDVGGKAYEKTWYTTEGDDVVREVYTFVSHARAGEHLSLFRVDPRIKRTNLLTKGGGWSIVPDDPPATELEAGSDVVLLGLPIKGSDEAWRCGQGFGGGLTHFGKYSCFSVDFECEEGTAVVAVLPGVVARVDDSNARSGGHVSHLFEGYNEVVVSHADGTEACYLHLDQHSAMVSVGQKVIKGQHLASTGSVGFAPWPHIHFQLNVSESSGEVEVGPAVPFAFESADGGRPFIPVAGYDYTPAGRVNTAAPVATEQLEPG
ncbi:hypothetical protein DIPPA_26472 [Diplonema papillatum]|nr:hypothetical protein DIPPA_26472 [Diplonema papillatum]